MIIGSSISVSGFIFDGRELQLLTELRNRVEADGGTIEAQACYLNDLRLPAFSIEDDYIDRVEADGGIIEAEHCFRYEFNQIRVS